MKMSTLEDWWWAFSIMHNGSIECGILLVVYQICAAASNILFPQANTCILVKC